MRWVASRRIVLLIVDFFVAGSRKDHVGLADHLISFHSFTACLGSGREDRSLEFMWKYEGYPMPMLDVSYTSAGLYMSGVKQWIVLFTELR